MSDPEAFASITRDGANYVVEGEHRLCPQPIRLTATPAMITTMYVVRVVTFCGDAIVECAFDRREPFPQFVPLQSRTIPRI